MAWQIQTKMGSSREVTWQTREQLEVWKVTQCIICGSPSSVVMKISRMLTMVFKICLSTLQSSKNRFVTLFLHESTARHIGGA